eukprot:14623312-Alexandrium_andersonii.AAC.1
MNSALLVDTPARHEQCHWGRGGRGRPRLRQAPGHRPKRPNVVGSPMPCFEIGMLARLSGSP